MRRIYTKSDLKIIRQMARDRHPARKIARKLKRSEGALRQKAFSIGVSLDTRG